MNAMAHSNGSVCHPTASESSPSCSRLEQLDGSHISLEELLRISEQESRSVSLRPSLVRSKIWFGTGGSEALVRSGTTLIIRKGYKTNYLAVTFIIAVVLLYLLHVFVLPVLLTLNGRSVPDIFILITICIAIGLSGVCILIASCMESVYSPAAYFEYRNNPGSVAPAIRTTKIARVWPSVSVTREEYCVEAIVVLHYYRPLLNQVPFLSKKSSLYGAFFISRSLQCFHLFGYPDPDQCLSASQHILRVIDADNLIPILDLSQHVDVTIVPR